MRIALVVLVVLVVLGLALALTAQVGLRRFDRATDRAVATLFAGAATGPGPVVTAAELAPLPAPVQRWLRRAGVLGQPRARTARLRQTGALRTAPGQAWMPAVAEQYVTLDEPGFLWAVRVTMKGVLPIAGRDSYAGGHGRMLITLGGLARMVDATGPEIDQGTLLRYLGEAVWYPSVALSPHLRWAPIDDLHARVTMTYGGVSASADLAFDADGRMRGMTAERYMDTPGGPRLAPWVVTATAWAVRGGPARPTEIPVAGTVAWRLPAGEFAYYRWTIPEVEYDRPARYSRR